MNLASEPVQNANTQSIHTNLARLVSPVNQFPNKIITSKYTLLTFIPLNFLYQISKGSTLFFFITLILVCIPKISPFEPYTYMLAFSIIVGVSMVKDAVEDYRRHKEDDKINKTTVKTVKKTESDDGTVVYDVLEKYCMELCAGDYILVENEEQIQADVVVLRSKKYHKDKLLCSNRCYIDTANIDGESNLKKRNAIISPKCDAEFVEPLKLCPCNEYFFSKLESFDLKDTASSNNEFECNFKIDGGISIANTRNVLLRGSILKNTEDCLCFVVAVGNDTKQSKGMYRCKKSKALFDERMNAILIVVLTLYGILMIITGIVGGLFLGKNQKTPYLAISLNITTFIQLIFSNYVIYTYMIPLSLYVILEIARFVHSIYITHDENMIIDGKEPQCRNSNAIQDLGVIDYILSDKTGTITKNSMTLKYIHENGKQALSDAKDLCSDLTTIISNGQDGLNDEALREIVLSSDSRKSKLMMVLNMLLCNSVEILNGRPEGISQEELCFLDSIANCGFLLCERDEAFVVVKLLGTKIKIDIIGTLEFTSKRQKMAVIIELFGKYFLVEKGSDLMLLDKGRDYDILKIINSSTDYRCLVMKYKEISPEEIERFKKATNMIICENDNEDDSFNGSLLQKKQHLEEEGFVDLAKDAEYLGSTFIEDKLQDEVQETIRILKEAGIRIWMITGDKKETAVACAKNSCVIENSNYIAIDGESVVKFMEKYVEDEKNDMIMQPSSEENASDVNPRYAGLHGDERLALLFRLPSVVIYRATPTEKGRIAALLVKSGRNTLSIGDGNNDIAMLKDSHVGVGIMGKEGTQASLVADFAIPEFRCLKNLILLHGRYNFIRYTKVALNSYYKNIVFIFAQFLYNMYSGASAFPLYNSFTLNYYNLFFTSLIPISIVFFDRDVPPSMAIEQAASFRNIRNGMDRSFILLNIFFAILESVIIFFGIKLFTLNDITNGSGMLGGYTSISTIFSIVIIYTVVLRQIRQVAYRVIFTDIAVMLTVILNLLLLFVIQELYNKEKYAIYYLLITPQFYFTILCLGAFIYSLDSVYENISLHLENMLKSKN